MSYFEQHILQHEQYLTVKRIYYIRLQRFYIILKMIYILEIVNPMSYHLYRLNWLFSRIMNVQDIYLK